MQDTNLVRYIMKHDGIAPAELAVHLGVKERAMRDRIRHANDSMHDRGIIVYDRARQRYVVDILDSEGFEAWLSGSAARDAFDRLPSTPEERVAYLLQDLLSRTEADSLISQLNAHAGDGTDVALDTDTARLLAFSKSISQLLPGDFDITIAPVMDAWGFTKEERHPPGWSGRAWRWTWAR